MSDDLTKKLEDLTEVDLKKVVGGKGINSTSSEEYCATCGRVTTHWDGVCAECSPYSIIGYGQN